MHLRRLGVPIRIAITLGAVIMVIAPLYSAFRIIDDRNERRANTAEAIAEARTTAAVNAARIETLAAVASSTCEALNTDADRLNAFTDYLEVAAKMSNPGPATDRFFADLPRPVRVDCTRPKPAAP